MDLNSKTSGVIGDVYLTVTDTITGQITDKRFMPNLVVDIGKSYIASRMIGISPTVMTNIALGSNSTSPTGGDATLGTELGRVVMTSSTSLNNVVTYTATFGAGIATGGIQEAGIFNATSAGTMLCRTTFPVVNKGSADSIAISWSVTIS